MDTATRQDARALILRMMLLSYGKVAALESHRGGEREAIGPPGESRPMHERWAHEFERAASDEDLRQIVEQARAELSAYVRRQLVPETTETWEELAARIVSDGWGVTAEECARAMRCTPTLVRRARMGEMRHPENGYPLPEPEADLLAWARKLDRAGLSVRQIEAVTGMAKSTLHDRLSR